MLDAHVHMGYYPRKGHAGLFYYSPQRICGVLKRCGIEEFIVSSTCAQIKGIKIADIVREAKEMRRIAGSRAHIFFWLSGHLYDEDKRLSWLNSGLFDGVKLHEAETPWIGERFAELCLILEQVEGRGLPAQIHAGPTGVTQPHHLRKLADLFPRVRFDFAHCRPMAEMAKVVAECPNVWTDTAYMMEDDFRRLSGYDWHDRLIFGSDMPVWQSREKVGLTERYRQYIKACERAGLVELMQQAFESFVRGRSEQFKQSAGVRSKHVESQMIDALLDDENAPCALLDYASLGE